MAIFVKSTGGGGKYGREGVKSCKKKVQGGKYAILVEEGKKNPDFNTGGYRNFLPNTLME